MKLVKKIIVVGFCLIAIGSVLAFISSLIENKSFLDSIIINNKVEYHREVEDIDKLIIKADIGQINLKVSDTDKIHYTYHGIVANSFKTDEIEDVLILDSSNLNLVSFTSIEDVKLDVFIPLDSKVDIIIENTGARVLVSGISLDTLSVSSDVGNIIIKDSIINRNLEASNRVGTIVLNNIKEPESLNIENTLGKINLIDVYGSRVYLKNDVGSLKYVNRNKDYSFKDLEIDVSVGKQIIKVK